MQFKREMQVLIYWVAESELQIRILHRILSSHESDPNTQTES